MSYMSSPPIAMNGGLDLETPPMAIPVGRLIAAKNYEPTQRGYMRMDGYERFDGRPKPSQSSYWLLYFSTGTAALAVGNVLTGATSGATGKVLELSVLTSGSYGGGNAVGYAVLTVVSGVFVAGENLQVAAVTKCVAASFIGGVLPSTNGVAIEQSAPTDTLNTTYLRDAITTARALIAAVPGAGNILGVWAYSGVKYAFRNNVGVTAADMYKSTAAGWVKVALGRSLTFTGGTTGYTPAIGDTITGATSGATAVLTGIAITSGLGIWGAAATGAFIFASQTGNFVAENLNIGAHLTVAAIAADSVAQTLGVSGRFDFVNHNFKGNAGSLKMYGCNGAGKGFEFDGTTFISITTGMTLDRPQKVSVYKNQLFFSFDGGSLQNSGPGTPYTWTIVTGANEIGVGDNIKALSQSFVDSLIVFGDNKIQQLTGSSVSDFTFTDVTTSAGGQEWTAQLVEGPIYIDERGIRLIATTPSYGNFNIGTLSQLVAPLIQEKIAAGYYPIASCVVRGKDQYRVFYSDNSVLVAYFSKTNDGDTVAANGYSVQRQLPTIMPLALSHTVTCACSCDDSAGTVGTDITLFGSDTGMVYEMDRGTSHDGGEVEAYFQTPWYFGQSAQSAGTPTMRKAWKKTTLELDADPTANIYVTAEYSYGDPDNIPGASLSFAVAGGGGVWDISLWNRFLWSQPQVGRASAATQGVGTNISISVYSNVIWDAPHTIHGMSFGFAPRGQER